MNRREFLVSAAYAAAVAPGGRAWAGEPGDTKPEGTELDDSVKRVLVVFMCHLDIGYTNTQAAVMRQYFDQWYPQAIATAARMRAAGGDRYVWTTFPWLLYEYLEQADPAGRRAMEQGVMAGDVAYLGLPFNWQTEMLDLSMVKGCLGFAATLDRRFGLKTIGAKMTDVPGHSRGLVRPLTEAGITLLDIGVNQASTPPAVPAAFRWAEPGGASIAMLYHTRDYGGLIRVPGSDLAIAVEIGDDSDNAGPHSAEEIAAIYAKLRTQFPQAHVRASSFNEIAAAMAPLHAGLPLVTAEIGDTWIYGVASDPPKIARYREVARARREWIGAGRFAAGDETDLQMLRRLPLAVEHTWGTDTKRYIDLQHYPPKELAKYLDTPGYRTMERSWAEKREDIDEGVARLPAALRAEAQQRLAKLQPAVPEHAGMCPMAPGELLRSGSLELRLDAQTGAITHLAKRGGRTWASPAQPLALFSYQTLTQPDYTAFLAAYVLSKEWWAPQDFGKPNIDEFPAVSKIWTPIVKEQWHEPGAGQQRIVSRLAIEDAAAEAKGLVAWPKAIWMEMLLHEERPVVDITLTTYGKVANRMPEAMWLSFRPEWQSGQTCMLTKVDQAVDPLDVLAGGGRRMHAVSESLRWQSGEDALVLTTLDAPMVAFAPQTPLNFSKALPDPRQGVHIGLYNNAWGTNYPQWASGDWFYRFSLAV